MLKCLRIYIQVCIFLLFIFANAGCNSKIDNSSNLVAQIIPVVKNGDLIFRRGTGVVGHVVTMADKQGLYSHVGIIVSKDTAVYVVHAVPHEPDFDGDFDRVKCENITKFIGRYPDANIGLYRLSIPDSLIAQVTKHALDLSNRKVPFDHDYNLKDTSALYCTELIEHLYNNIGISISEGRRTQVTLPVMSGEYIMPSDLTTCSKLTLVIAQ